MIKSRFYASERDRILYSNSRFLLTVSGLRFGGFCSSSSSEWSDCCFPKVTPVAFIIDFCDIPVVESCDWEKRDGSALLIPV